MAGRYPDSRFGVVVPLISPGASFAIEAPALDLHPDGWHLVHVCSGLRLTSIAYQFDIDSDIRSAVASAIRAIENQSW